MKAKFINESELFKGKSEEDLYNSLKDINPLYAKIVAYISTHYINWSRQISSGQERHYFRFDTSKQEVSFNYMKYRIHYETGKVILGISNKLNRYDYYVVKDFKDFIELITYKPKRSPIQPAPMRESVEDVFKPKSEEEIDQNLSNDPDYKIGDKKSATEHLLSAINRRNVSYAKYALRHGAKPLYTYVPKTNGSSGNLWVAYNMGDAEETQDLIIEMLKSKQITQLYKKYPKFRESILQKTLYMGMTDVMKWILENFKETTYKDVHNAIQLVDIDWGTSAWSGYQATLDLLIPWLKERKPIKESIGDILKPKSREEIQKALEYTEEDEYTDMVDKEIDRQRVMFGDDTIFSKYRELVDAGFKEKTPPSEVASQIIQTFYQNDWKPDGAMALTNTGGIELKVVESGDGVEYRFTGEIIPHGADIEYDYRDEDNEQIDWSEMTDEDERELKAFFRDKNENKWYLEDFMRIDYPYFG